jgi:hypothetical protein
LLLELRIVSAISRRPAAASHQREKEGKHSFLTDESGVFHFTTEDRAPTAEDPALQ